MNEEQATALLLLAEQADSAADSAARHDRLEAEREHLHAALTWFLQHGKTDAALRFGAALYDFWHDRGYVQEGREWLQRILAAPGGQPPVRAKVLHCAGMLAFRGGDAAAARPLLEESLKITRRLGDKQQVAATLAALGRVVALRLGDYGAGHRLFEESLALARDLKDKQAEARAIHCLAALARLEGNADRAIALYEQSMSLRRDLGDTQGVAIEQLNLGFMTFNRGDIGTARRLFAESLQSSYERGDMYVMPPCLVGFAGVALQSGDPSRAARVLGAADAVLKTAGLVLDPDDRVEYDRIAGALRTKLGDETMEAMRTEGRAMQLGQAVGFALEATGR